MMAASVCTSGSGLPNHALKHSGFTLVELSIVLLILGILARATIMPLSAARLLQLQQLNEEQLQVIKHSLLAHIVATGVVPCPLLPVGSGLTFGESQGADSNSGRTAPEDVCLLGEGHLPSRSLGLSGSVDAFGALLDSWNKPYHYAVSLSNHQQHGDPRYPDWTTVGEGRNVGLQALSADITICLRTVGNNCSGHDVRVQEVVFAVWSSGQDDSAAGAQAENLDADRFLVEQAYSKHAERPFDDLLVWATAADVMYWQLRAGWLP